MAYRLANGNYRHEGVDIIRDKTPSSTGWMFVWSCPQLGKKFDTLNAAVSFINKKVELGEIL